MKNCIVNAWNKIIHPGSARTANDEPALILYWLPGTNIPEQISGRLEKYMTRVYPATGPGGTGGTLCAPFEAIVNYNPKTQDWKQQNGVWIGFRKDLEPSMLLRKSYKHFAGYEVVLGNEKPWIIPVAVPFSPICSLPKVAKLNENNEWTTEIDERYRHISEAAAFIFENIDENGILENAGENETFQIAAMALAANYDLSAFEISALGLLNDAAITGIFQALLDEPGLLEILNHQSGKKKACGERSMKNGDKD